MSKLESINKAYKRGGVRSVLKDIWDHVFLSSPVAPYIKKAIGGQIHEKLVMYPRVGYWPHIKEPRSFNEKIAHRKHYSENPLFSRVADKWAVRDYVKEKVGDEILNDVYLITTDPADLDLDDLPDEFVVKANHGSGMCEIVDDKEDVDVEELRSKCYSWLSEDFGEITNEYWYSEINPKILVENRLYDDEHGTPIDYKFFVFNGEVKLVQVDLGRFSEHTRRMYSPDWEPHDFTLRFPQAEVISEPTLLDEMIETAETLGEDFDFARVDLYQPNGEEIVFGEITLSPGAGHEGFTPTEVDFELGSYW